MKEIDKIEVLRTQVILLDIAKSHNSYDASCILYQFEMHLVNYSSFRLYGVN